MFVIKWHTYGYVAAGGLRSSRPYTQDIKQAKTWKSRANAEKFLKLKDPGWASMCIIEEIPS